MRVVDLMTSPEVNIVFGCAHTDKNCGLSGSTLGPDPAALVQTGRWEWRARCRNCKRPVPVAVVVGEDGHLALEANGTIVAQPPTPVIDIFDPSYIPDHPYEIYIAARDEVWRVRAALSEIGGQVPVAVDRMLFVQLFSILEAYLGDRVLKAAATSEKVRMRLAEYEGISSRQVPVGHLLLAPMEEILRNQVLTYLGNVSFHDLAKADRIYAAAFGGSLLPPAKADQDFLKIMVRRRHDCVHRNGATREGEMPNDINEDLLIRLTQAFNNMAQAVHDLIFWSDRKDAGKSSKPVHASGPPAQ